MTEENKKSRIYTKKGDQGKTFLVSGSCVDKFDVRVEAYGTVDELNSHIGLIRFLLQTSKSPEKNVLLKQEALLEYIQNHLFRIGSLLACEEFTIQKKLPPIQELHTQFLEKSIDEFDASLPELKNFILPSGCEISCQYHIARTLCRRAERRTAEIDVTSNELNQNCLIYLNRLSDLFFVLARWNNHNQQIKETLWDKEK
ncbi:MAG: cob(I)yrinic acid a,c-diamide adenosyltransferase [Bdellovibrionaceae bacterium]|nr:cob(I)yrinic acid a,c-diamide adenosyltransferase [Pseudobdellovibrionaceae bacterium]